MEHPEAESKAKRGVSSLRRLIGPMRRWAPGVLLAGAAVAVYLFMVQDLPTVNAPLDIPWPALALMFFAVELFVVRVQFRRDSYSFPLVEIPLMLGLFFTSPRGLMAAQVLGAALALLPSGRRSVTRKAFRMAHLTLGAGLALAVFHALIGDGAPGAASWASGYAAAAVTALVADLAVSLAAGPSGASLLALFTGAWFGRVAALTNASLGLLGVTVLWTLPAAGWLLAAPAVAVLVAYRAYSVERQKHESLASLYESTRTLMRSVRVEEAVQALLDRARKMFRADVAAVTLFPVDEHDVFRRSILGPGDRLVIMESLDQDASEGLWAAAVAEGRASLDAHPMEDLEMAREVAGLGLSEAMVAPLTGETASDPLGVVATLLVGNGPGDMGSFGDEDRKLFETLVSHASGALVKARLVEQLEESLARLTETNRMKDDFVATVSHELRTPLTVIQGFVMTLLRDDVNFDASQRRGFLEAAHRGSERLRDLIEQLLMVSRLESHQETVAVAPLSLSTVAYHVVEELRPRVDGHTLQVRLSKTLPKVLTDGGKVHQILSNLVENALKYSPPKSAVTISGRTEGDTVVVTVSDEGPGIPPQAQSRIFDRFYQVDSSSTRAVGGTGLGLYISRRLAEELGASLRLERSDGDGSVFALRLPLRPPRASDDEAAPPSARTAGADRPADVLGGPLVFRADEWPRS